MSIRESSPARLPTRREMLSRAGGGFGSLALAGLLADQGLLADSTSATLSPLAAKPAHFAPKAKSVIFLFMYGGPSHIDLFDHKPALKKFAGKKVSEAVNTKGARSQGGLFPSPYKFERYGESGHWVSDRFPHLSRVIDHTGEVRKPVGNPVATFSVALKFVGRGEEAPLTAGTLGVDRLGDLFAGKFFQGRLVVKEVDMTGAAIHEEEDDALGLRGEMSRFGGQRRQGC